MLLNELRFREGDEKNRSPELEDTALIVYTSGTTGVAKGVMLSYKNLLFQVKALSEAIPYSQHDRFLSILPLNHMLEITGGLILPLYVGARITYCRSLKAANLLSLMQQTHTTVMICVPLVLRMLHDGIIKKVEKLPLFKRKMFYSLLRLCRFLLKFNFRIGRWLFKPIRREFGGNLKCLVSGGAPLDVEVELDFNAWGFYILQGYGLTESAPVISVNTYKAHRIGSVGRPLPGVEVKINKLKEEDDCGEIITRGPHIMKGYFQNEAKTKEIIKDGWLYTGDIGYLDKDGFLYISGRLRNLIVLGGGKKVFPEEVEEVIGRSPFIKEICVLGKIADRGVRKGHEEVYAIIVPSIEYFPEPERQNKEKIRNKISEEINRLSKNLADYKRIIDFELWYDELPKTATKKIRRKMIADMIRSRNIS
jgi:long-chain acyl-CoA synthetase